MPTKNRSSTMWICVFSEKRLCRFTAITNNTFEWFSINHIRILMISNGTSLQRGLTRGILFQFMQIYVMIFPNMSLRHAANFLCSKISVHLWQLFSFNSSRNKLFSRNPYRTCISDSLPVMQFFRGRCFGFGLSFWIEFLIFALF